MKKTQTPTNPGEFQSFLTRIASLESRLEALQQQHSADLAAVHEKINQNHNGHGQSIQSLGQQLQQQVKIPVGTVIISALPNPPPCWLVCDGSSFWIRQYPDLFSAIGHEYSQPKKPEKFSVPNMINRIPFQGARGHTDGHWVVPIYPNNLPHHTHGIQVDVTTLNMSHTHSVHIHGEGAHFHYVKKKDDGRRGHHLAFQHALSRGDANSGQDDLRIPHDHNNSATQYPDGQHSHTAACHYAMGQMHHSHVAHITNTDGRGSGGEPIKVTNPVLGFNFFILAKSHTD